MTLTHPPGSLPCPWLLRCLTTRSDFHILWTWTRLDSWLRLFLNFTNIYFCQKDAIEDSIEIVLEKLLHVTKDVVAKVLPSFILAIVIQTWSFVLKNFCCRADFKWSKPMLKCSFGKIWPFQMSCCMYKYLISSIIVAASVSTGCNLVYFVWWYLVLLQVIVPLLVSDDEKILVVCINCLTKVSPIWCWHCCLIIPH